MGNGIAERLKQVSAGNKAEYEKILGTTGVDPGLVSELVADGVLDKRDTDWFSGYVAAMKRNGQNTAKEECLLGSLRALDASRTASNTQTAPTTPTTTQTAPTTTQTAPTTPNTCNTPTPETTSTKKPDTSATPEPRPWTEASQYKAKGSLDQIACGGRVMQKGEGGPAVADVQTLLKKAGFEEKEDGIDSRFGDKTEAQVRAFQESQKDKGLVANGRVDAKTLQRLREVAAQNEKTQTTSNTSTTPTTPTTPNTSTTPTTPTTQTTPNMSTTPTTPKPRTQTTPTPNPRTQTTRTQTTRTEADPTPAELDQANRDIKTIVAAGSWTGLDTNELAISQTLARQTPRSMAVLEKQFKATQTGTLASALEHETTVGGDLDRVWKAMSSTTRSNLPATPEQAKADKTFLENSLDFGAVYKHLGQMSPARMRALDDLLREDGTSLHTFVGRFGGWNTKEALEQLVAIRSAQR